MNSKLFLEELIAETEQLKENLITDVEDASKIDSKLEEIDKLVDKTVNMKKVAECFGNEHVDKFEDLKNELQDIWQELMEKK